MSNILLMPFIDKSESFTNGFECGILWQELTESQTFDKRLIHLENKDQIILMLDHFGYEYSINPHDGCWAYLYAQPVNISEVLG